MDVGLTSRGQEEADARALTDCKREKPLRRRHRRVGHSSPLPRRLGTLSLPRKGRNQHSLASAGTEDEQTYRVTQESKPSQRHSGSVSYAPREMAIQRAGCGQRQGHSLNEKSAKEVLRN